MYERIRGKIALIAAIAAVVVIGGVGAWNSVRRDTDAKARPIPLGVSRQQLFDSLSSIFALSTVE